ncbi:hypothetical protein KA093_02745 [Candidatus Saccharibacteria bacterium]|nr:hypothetical protein [Candidatus Saccharibacteria bacterium]
MDIVYYLFGIVATCVMIALTIGLIRPSLLSNIYQRIGKTNLSRKFIAGTMIPALIVSGGVMNATEPASIRLERETREAAQLQTIKDADAKKAADAEQARLADETRKQAAIEATAKQAAEEQAAQQRLEAEKAAAMEAASLSQTPEQNATTSQNPIPVNQGAVHQGAFCSPQGAIGVFSSGNAAVCAPASDGRNRWQLQ